MENEHQHQDEIFMQRALDLALLGAGNVSPNPMVGCVIVYKGKIIGESWHKKYGEAHAEVNAIENVKSKELLKESTVYVTLEPCSHFGKTPPCADLLVNVGVKRVVVANVDSNPLVSGQGIQKLVNAGIQVSIGTLSGEANELNKKFFTVIEKQRPYIILKWAETSDGYIAQENFDSKWISNELSRKLVHKWRGEEDAIVVGTSTVKFDNPRLNVRDWSGRNPIRIVIDRLLKLNPDLNVFDHSQQTICYNLIKDENQDNLEFVKLPEKKFLQQLTKDLYLKKIQSVLVEGGTQTLQHFIDDHLWDEARIFTSEKIFGKGIKAPKIEGLVSKEEKIENDFLKIIRPPSTA